ncbi:hypothetical protein [Massilibacteroides sp.]|uniref:hypothetical protein n=1 Tax=Massilibacteroides sp. TaxID=2034766 RepID=UPI002635DFD3|nr:hypothetical protein [Massilibacteroides sp.]MDD4515399.1 hypothetical protein [Massilibacteroides sp.]
MNDLLLITIPAAVTSIITYVLTRNRNIADVDKINVEVAANEIDNVEKVARIWRDLSEDLRKRFMSEIDDLRSINQTMKDKLNVVQGENVQMRKELLVVQKENEERKIQFNKVLSENNELKKQMTSLEKQLKDSKCENAKLFAEVKKSNKNYSEVMKHENI